MKYFILFTLLFSCTKKYETFHVIDKYSFNKNDPESPITGKLYPGEKEVRSHCEGQFFWSSNAKTKTDNYVNSVVQNMCPEAKYLVNNRLEETWWTTIVYSRSCVRMESYCGRVPKKD